MYVQNGNWGEVQYIRVDWQRPQILNTLETLVINGVGGLERDEIEGQRDGNRVEEFRQGVKSQSKKQPTLVYYTTTTRLSSFVTITLRRFKNVFFPLEPSPPFVNTSMSSADHLQSSCTLLVFESPSSHPNPLRFSDPKYLTMKMRVTSRGNVNACKTNH